MTLACTPHTIPDTASSVVRSSLWDLWCGSPTAGGEGGGGEEGKRGVRGESGTGGGARR
jgi:hypothetical protein